MPEIKHVSLVTGTKQYLGSSESYGSGKTETPFRESAPRVPGENFYYALEDTLFTAAERDGFSWNVHRPHTVIGYALGNAMNMGVTLRGLRVYLQSNRQAVYLSRLADSVEFTDRPNRCVGAGAPVGVGGHHSGCTQRSIQHC